MENRICGGDDLILKNQSIARIILGNIVSLHVSMLKNETYEGIYNYKKLWTDREC